MIKLSLQSLSYRDTFNAGKITLLEIIDKAAEYQMDGVDLHYTHFASTDDDYLEEMLQIILYGVAGPAMGREMPAASHWMEKDEP